MCQSLRAIETLALAIDARKGGHLPRIEALALEIGRRLHWNEAELAALRAAALLHDAGELAVPQHLVGIPGGATPGSATPEESEKNQAHPAVGSAMAAHMGLSDAVAAMIRSHHERWDGHGYPDGLQGHAIPVGSRILAVADCLARLAPEHALEALRRGSGAAFDPDLARLASDHLADLERVARPQPELDFQAAVASAAREDRALARLAGELGRSLSLHETLGAFDGTLQLLIGYNCMAVYLIGEDGACEYDLSPTYLSGDEALLADARDGVPTAQSRSELLVPLEIGGKRVGLLALYHAGRGAFRRDDLRLLLAIRGRLASAVDNARRHERAERLAAVDDLTCLPNSRSLFLRLDAELSRCRRNRTTLAVLVCDLGGLPQSRYPAIAAGLRRICREDDCVARMGDSFALVLSSFSRQDLAEKQKLIAATVGQSGNAEPGERGFEVRIGAAFYPEDGLYAEDLLAAADSRQ